MSEYDEGYNAGWNAGIKAEMNQFQDYLSRTSADDWRDLTHRDICQLCALWIAENRYDFEDCIWRLEPNNAMATQTIEMFGALKRCDNAHAAALRLSIADSIKDAVIEQAKQSAESWLRMRRSWLRELTRNSANAREPEKLEG
jgi:L-ribulose-5-phosphate 3-epimerase UlaE